MNIESTPKTKKIRNATKTPSHQNTPKPDNKGFNLGVIWCFCDLVAKSDFSEGTQSSKLGKKTTEYEDSPQRRKGRRESLT
jgi:hypothetical protein